VCVRALAASGIHVRALVREPPTAPDQPGIDVAVGDFDDADSIDRALCGIETMLLAGRDGPEAAVRHRRVVDRARRAGVRHVVRLSAAGAAAGSPIALMREHEEVDAELRASGIEWTLLRPHLYMQNLLRAAVAVRLDGVLAAPMEEHRYPLVDTRDVGAAAAAVLADPGRHRGETHVLTGPQAVGYGAVARALGAVAGRPVRYEPVAPADQEARLVAAGMPGWRAFDLAHIARAYAPADNEVTPAIADLLGRPPTSLTAFLEDHAAVFAS
jgi:uncharacterized protein YbjT (DUF2867 family)